MSYSIARSRWLAKKLARRGCALGSWASGSLLARRLLRERPEVRAITYHRFDRVPRDPYAVSVETFEAQVRYLAENELAISLDDLEQFIAGHKTLKPGSVLLTTDDGQLSVYTRAFPILKHYGVPSVSFVTASLIEDGRSRPSWFEPYMRWDQVAELAEHGMEIGSHAYTHDSLGRMPLSQAREQAERSRELIAARVGKPVRSFAYPFGVRDHHNAETGRMLVQTGYSTVFTSVHGAIAPGDDPSNLLRVKIEGGEGLWMFRQACRGGMDPWAVIDRL